MGNIKLSVFTFRNNLRLQCGSANECLHYEDLGEEFWAELTADQIYDTCQSLGFNDKVSNILYKGYYKELLAYYKTVKTDVVPKELLLTWYLEKHHNDLLFDTYKNRTIILEEEGFREFTEPEYDEIHNQFSAEFPWVHYSEGAVYKKTVSFSHKRQIDTLTETVKRMPTDARTLDMLLEELCDNLSIADIDRKIAKIYLRVWFTGIVHRAINPGGKFDLILVLNGRQGSGKTTFLENIFPEDTYVMSNSKDLDSKDKLVNLSTNSVIIWDEIGSFSSKYMVESIKQFLTITKDSFRPVWGRQVVTRGRRCVFSATTNDPDILDDLTGNRRYMVLTVGNINHQKNKELIPFLLGSIYQKYMSGVIVPYLNSEESALQRRTNERYAKEDAYATLVYEWVNALPDKPRIGFTTIDLTLDCLCMPAQALTPKISRHVGKILRSLGYFQKRVRDSETKRLKSVWVKED